MRRVERKEPMKKAVFILFSLVAGFGAGAVVTFMASFTYSVLRRGGLW